MKNKRLRILSFLLTFLFVLNSITIVPAQTLLDAETVTIKDELGSGNGNITGDAEENQTENVENKIVNEDENIQNDVTEENEPEYFPPIATKAFAGIEPAIATDAVELANWKFTSSATPVSAPIIAEGGEFANNSEFSAFHVASGIPATINATNSSLTIWLANWKVGSYWQAKTSTLGYESISVSASQYSTSTGASKFQFQYSVDGTNFVNFEDEYAVDITNNNKLMTPTAFDLPSEANDASDLYIRWLATEVAGTGGGNSRISAVTIAGTPTEGGEVETQVKPVTATPVSDTAIADGSKITLQTATSDATIYYILDGSLPSANSTEYLGSIIADFNSTPFIIKAVAVKEGLEDSAVSTFTYTKASFITNAEAKTKANDEIVTIKGVATYSTQSRTIFMQDTTGGICIDFSSGGLAAYVGKEIQVTGKISRYGDMVQVVPTTLADVIVTEDNPAMPEPLEITIAQLMETRQYEGMLVVIKNARLTNIAGTGTSLVNHTITQDDISTTLRTAGLSFAKDSSINVKGIASYFNAIQLQANAGDVTAGDVSAVATVTAAPENGGTVAIGGKVTLSTVTEGATIEYALNGGAPQTSASNSVDVTIDKFSQVGDTAVITATAKKGSDSSAEKIFTYTQTKTAMPTANLAPGEIAEWPVNINLTSADDSKIYYTLDNTDPTTLAGTEYTGPISITGPTTIKAIAVSDGCINSNIAAFSYTNTIVHIPDGESGKAAEWNISGVANEVLGTSVAATGGDYAAKSTIQFFKNDPSVAQSLTFGSNGINISGLNNQENQAYWLATVSTKDMTNLSISWNMRSSSTGPRDFKLQYSLDNNTWVNTDTTVVVPSGVALNLTKYTAALPKNAADRDTLYLRWLLTSNVSAAGNSIAATGTHQINFVELKGDYIIGENQVKPVTANPNTGTAPLNAAIELFSNTEGAAVLYSTDGLSYIPQSSVTLDAFPVTFYAKATKTGMDDSRTKIFTYNQSTVETVETSLEVGAVPADSIVKLTSKTPGATIYYTVTTKAGIEGEEAIGLLTLYSIPITLTEDMFPVKITTRATCENYLDNAAITYTYTLKPASGGEKNYFGQLHSHTTNSDGAGTLEEAYTWARDNAKLDFFAVTDHSNSFDTANKDDKAGTYNLGAYNSSNEKWQDGVNAAAAAMTEKFISTYGFEMTWSGGPGHMNTFNTEGFVSRNNTELNNKGSDAGLRAYYELLKAHPESVSQFNHPGSTFGNFNNFAYHDPAIDKRVTLVEVGNGEGTIGSGGYFPSYEQYDMALDKGWHVAPTNNQDNHKKYWGNANTARTVIYTNDFSTTGLFQALRDRRVYATEDVNLDIVYTLNGEILGTILNDVPDTAHIKAIVTEPDTTDRIESISVISNGGVVVYSETYNTQSATLDHTIENPDPGYYYIKVVQADGNIAVTAPVWLGNAEAVGITEVTSSTAMPVTTEELTIATQLFNSEINDVILNSIKYEIKDGVVLSEENLNITIEGDGIYKHELKYMPMEVGKFTVLVTVMMTVNGVDKTYTKEIELNVRDITKLQFIGIDASHRNEYVNGNYKDSMGNFSKLAIPYGFRVVELKSKEELLAAMENPLYKMLVITAPSRRITPVTDHKFYDDDEIAGIAAFAKSGKPVIISGWSDTYENYTDVTSGLDNHMAGQQNKLLMAIGAKLRLADDAALDDVSNGGQSPRLYLTDYNNYVSPLLAGVSEGQKYSQYGGSTVYAVEDDGGTPATTLPASVTPIISGHATTYSKDSDGDGFGLVNAQTPIPRYGSGEGKVLITASETIDHGNGITSEVIVSGGAFMSNFEIQAQDFDNPATSTYSNSYILTNLLESIAPPVEITSIADVKSAGSGTFTIEGIATSNVNTGVNDDNNTGFFDSIYMQDATGGINLFPVADGVKEGQTIRVTGKVSEYQGEMQLAVTKVQLVNALITPVSPSILYTQDTMSSENTGMLVQTSGKVLEVVADNGVVSQIIIDDGSGPALVYINAYITPNKDLSFVKVGADISVRGLASYGEVFGSDGFLPRIRVRDRGEIVEVASEKPSAPTANIPSGKVELPLSITLTAEDGAVIYFTIDGSIPAISADNLYTESIVLETLPTTIKAIAVIDGLASYISTFVYTAVTAPIIVEAVTASPASGATIALNSKVTLSTETEGAIIVYTLNNGAEQTTSSNMIDITIDSFSQTGNTAVIMARAVKGEYSSVETTFTYTEEITPKQHLITREQTENGTISANKTTVENGGSVTFTFTPNSGYQLSYATVNGQNINVTNNAYTVQNVTSDITVVAVFSIINDNTGNNAGGSRNTGPVINSSARENVLTIGDEATPLSAVEVNKAIAQFTDVDNHWAYQAILFVVDKGILVGTSETTFGPNDVMTRGMFVTALGRLAGVDQSQQGKSQFSDVADNAYYAKYVTWSAANGIVAGVGNNKFSPDEPITREQLAVILCNYLAFMGVQLPQTTPDIVFVDEGNISEWAKVSVYQMQKSGILVGKGNNSFDPKAQATRAEICVVIQKVLGLMNK